MYVLQCWTLCYLLEIISSLTFEKQDNGLFSSNTQFVRLNPKWDIIVPPFEIVHCDGVYVLRLHSRSSTKRLRALCMANETWTLIIPPHYMVDHAAAAASPLQPTKSRKCSSRPCGWWEFFVTNGQKSWIFPLTSCICCQPNIYTDWKEVWFSCAPPRRQGQFIHPTLDGWCPQNSGTICEKYTICVEMELGTRTPSCNVCSCVRKTQRGFRTGRCVNVDRLVLVAKDSWSSLSPPKKQYNRCQKPLLNCWCQIY